MNGWQIERDADGQARSMSWASGAPTRRHPNDRRKPVGGSLAGFVDAAPIRLPFEGSTPIARQCSYDGAQDAKERAGRQGLALLALYRQRGPQTDQEAADALGIQRNSVNARRAALIAIGLVDAEPKGTRKNARTGINNSTWGLAKAAK